MLSTKVSCGPYGSTAEADSIAVGHTLGLLHEHTRRDRDHYVRIDFTNVQPSFIHNFEQMGGDDPVNGAYDYDSIMHYNSWAFALDRSKPTVVPIDSSGRPRADVIIGQRSGLSDGDIASIASLYDLDFIPRKQKETTTPESTTSSSNGLIGSLTIIAIAAISVSTALAMMIARKMQRSSKDEIICTPQSLSDTAFDCRYRSRRQQAPVTALELTPIHTTAVV